MATATAISYPTNEINETFNFADTLNSYELVQNIWVDINDVTNDTYVEIIYNSVTITINLLDECRYTPVNIAFINKEGGLQFLDFFKARVDSMTITDEMFESDRGQPSIGEHQYTRYNVQAQSKFTVNSGFVNENMNETFKQLLFSERIWEFANNIYTPLNIKAKQFVFKNRQNDRLINYELEFEYGFNEINNV